MKLEYPQGYSIDPFDCSADELMLQLSKFSFAACGMQHEQKIDPMAAVVCCPFTEDGFNLGCAHSGVRKEVDDKQFLRDAVNRIFNENLINQDKCQAFLQAIDLAVEQLYVIDILQRNSQHRRMLEYPDWKNHIAYQPKNDRSFVEFLLKALEPDSLIHRLIQRCYDSFSTETVDEKIKTRLTDPVGFQTKIKFAQILVASDLRKVAHELRDLCTDVEFSDELIRF